MFYWIFITWIVLDAITKYSAQQYFLSQCGWSLCNDHSISLLWDFLYLDLHYNSWIAFGIQLPFLKVLTIALIICIYYYYRTERNKETDAYNKKIFDISFWSILAGAIGNGFERIAYEQVIDFIWVKYFSIFNLADIFITLWALWLIYYYYNKKELCLLDQKE